MSTSARLREPSRLSRSYLEELAFRKQAAAEALASIEAEEAAEEAEAAEAAAAERSTTKIDDATKNRLKLLTWRVQNIEKDPDREVRGSLLAATQRDSLLQTSVAEPNRKVAVRLWELARRCNKVVDAVADTADAAAVGMFD